MKKIALYVCEVCGTKYSEEEKCVRCERTHKDILTIAGKRYLPYTNDQSGMPIAITVKSEEDGKTYIYKRG